MKKFNDLAGFDMEATLAWYRANYDKLLKLLPKPRTNGKRDFSLAGREHIQLELGMIKALIDLFPAAARQRSILTRIVGQPAAWFKKGMTSVKPEITNDLDEALSLTAIVPAKTDYAGWKPGNPVCEIWLYGISDLVCPSEVQEIVLAQSLVHEFAHSIITPVLYLLDYNLQIGETLRNGQDVILQFAELAERLPPISHYASAYREKNNAFKTVGPEKDPGMAINEELAETIAAYLLDLVFCADKKRRMNPLVDRPQIKEFVKDFLAAERI